MVANGLAFVPRVGVVARRADVEFRRDGSGAQNNAAKERKATDQELRGGAGGGIAGWTLLHRELHLRDDSLGMVLQVCCLAAF